MRKIIYQSSVVLMILLTSVSCGVLKNNTGSALIGTWQMCDSNGVVEENLYGKIDHIRYKIISTDKFTLIDLLSKNKQVLNSFVGSYTVDKDIFTENILFTNSNFNSLLGNTYSYNYKIENDLLFIAGINNSYNEVWKRVKQ